MADATSPRDIANKGFSLILHRLAQVKAGDVAAEMKVSDSTFSKLKNENAEAVLLMAAHLGLKLVPAEVKCLRPSAFAFLTDMHETMVRKSNGKIWDDEFQASGFGPMEG